MRTRTALLTLLLVLAACDGGGTTPTPPPTVSGFAVVSGSGQRAQVQAPAGTALAVASGDPTLLPELLVGRVLLTQAEGSASVHAGRNSESPSFQTALVPAGTVVNWEVGLGGVPGPDARCGLPRVAATQADDSAYVANGWRRGTLADTTCVARTALYHGTTLIEADSFTAVFTPGPPALGKRLDGYEPDAPRVLLLPRNAVQDAHGNAIPYRVQTKAADSLVWAGGATWGTPESRTLHWKDVSGNRDLPSGAFHLVDESGARIARVRYTLYVSRPGLQYASEFGLTID